MKKINEVHGAKNSNPVKVIQFGEGNFLRAFVDYLIQRLNEETDYCGSVAVVQPIDHGMTKMLDDQDGKYTHFMKGLENGEAKSTHKVIDVISKTIRPYEDFQSYLDLAKLDEADVIISNTTEAGIVFEDSDAVDMNPPKTFPAKLTRLLMERFDYVKGDVTKGYSVIPCELISDNGKALKTAVLEYAKLWSLSEEFVNWVHEANDFASTLVDRIVPGYPRETITEVLELIGYEDKLVVESERFLLWVIEDLPRIKDRLPLEKLGAGVIFTKDITPYKVRKVRILNGLHTFMVPVGLCAGIETVKESVESGHLGALIKQVLDTEIIPSLDMDKEELTEYGHEVINRFKNPYIKHLLTSISLNSIAKFETRVLPSILNYYKKFNKLPEGLVFSLASLISFYKGDLKGQSFDLRDSDEVKEYFKGVWAKVDGSEESYKLLAQEVLAKKSYWVQDLSEIEGFVPALASKLQQIQEQDFIQLMEGELNG